MSLLPSVQWLAATPGSITLRESWYAYPLVESAHVLTLCVFVGLAVMLDVRLLGITLSSVPFSEFKRRLCPWIKGGLVVMIKTGLLVFYARTVCSLLIWWIVIYSAYIVI